MPGVLYRWQHCEHPLLHNIPPSHSTAQSLWHSTVVCQQLSTHCHPGTPLSSEIDWHCQHCCHLGRHSFDVSNFVYKNLSKLYLVRHFKESFQVIIVCITTTIWCVAHSFTHSHTVVNLVFFWISAYGHSEVDYYTCDYTAILLYEWMHEKDEMP